MKRGICLKINEIYELMKKKVGVKCLLNEVEFLTCSPIDLLNCRCQFFYAYKELSIFIG